MQGCSLDLGKPTSLELGSSPQSWLTSGPPARSLEAPVRGGEDGGLRTPLRGNTTAKAPSRGTSYRLSTGLISDPAVASLSKTPNVEGGSPASHVHPFLSLGAPVSTTSDALPCEPTSRISGLKNREELFVLPRNVFSSFLPFFHILFGLPFLFPVNFLS